MTETRRNYLSYMLRLWRDSDTENVWRVSLESVHTSERWGFAGVDDLLGFLQQQTGTLPDTTETSGRTDGGGDEPTTKQID